MSGEWRVASGELRERLLALVGTPYGDRRFEPADCWGFVRYCYGLAGITLPRSIWRCRRLCREVRDGPRRFMDVVYFRDFIEEERHVGITLDNLYLIQSSSSTNGVALLRFNRPGVSECVQGVYRLKAAS